MYTLFRNISLRNFLSLQAPTLFVSFMIAELFYKFHSFTLECLAFLATWFVLDAGVTTVRNFWIGRSTSATTGSS